ncbi:MAG: hypothetical protein KQH67_12865 [Bacteroidetes bacterium]|nr:hypothetical protein [Bacteroidota bacterium]
MISYIIVFFLLIIGVIIWQFRSNTHFLRLSNQEYPELSLSVLISKKERKIDQFIVRVNAKQQLSLQQIKFELISPERAFQYISSHEISDTHTFPNEIGSSDIYEATYSYEKLKDIITTRMSNLSSFRMVVELQNNKLYKSHELKFDNLWKIYKADSGRYN